MLTIEQVSTIVSALAELVDADAARRFCDTREVLYIAPNLLALDAAAWHELLGDREAAVYLTSGTLEAKQLLRSLQVFCGWRGQAVTDEMSVRFRNGN